MVDGRTVWATKHKEHGFSRIARKTRILVLVLMIGFMFLGLSIASEDEVSQLENELVSSGYGWLVDFWGVWNG